MLWWTWGGRQTFASCEPVTLGVLVKTPAREKNTGLEIPTAVKVPAAYQLQSAPLC